MGFLNLRWCQFFMIVLSSAGLGLVFPLLVHGNVPVDVRQDDPGRPGSTGADVPSPDLSKTYVCGEDAQGKQEIKKTELTGATGLKFKCAPTLTLGPPSDTDDFLNVYVYNQKTTSCDTETKTLNSVVSGARLTKSVEDKMAPSSDPVYTLTYTNAPDESQTLCYTCNSAAEENLKLRAAQASTVECTILINLNAKTQTPPEGPNEGTAPDVDGTKPPTSTSGAGAMKASAATAAIGFLLVLPRL